MKTTTFALLFCGLLAAQADFVQQSGSSFTTTADLDGDGRSDLVLVDGSNATVRVGYQLSANTITWSTPRSLGLDEVSDITCGNLLDGGHDVLVATEPMINRYNIYHLDAPSSSSIVPMPVFSRGAGSKSMLAMDIGGSGNTPHDDLFTVSTMNGIPAIRAVLMRSDGTTFSELDTGALPSEWNRLNEVEYATGLHAMVAMDEAGSFNLIDLTGGVISPLDSVGGFSATTAYGSFIPPTDTYAQFLFWEPGQSTLKTCAIEELPPGTYIFSATTSYDLGSPIESVHLVEGDGITRLAVIFKGGDSAVIFDYDGTGAPTFVQEIFPPSNELLIGFLPLGTDDLVMLSSTSGDLSGVITANQHNFAGGQFVSTGTQALPAARISSRANVMTFESEPFVDNTPRLLQRLRAGDWTSQSEVSSGNLSSSVETDSGTTYGLGNPQTVSLGTADPAAVYTLDNQLHEAISTFSFDPARGTEVVNVTIVPESGVYGVSVDVAFFSNPSVPVFYRTSPTNTWSIYNHPFTLFEDTTVQYLAFNGSELSVIREATYTFSETPSNLDSDGDGVPDYVELANGLDPLESGLDADGDGYSDLDELLAGTDPTDDTDVPTTRMEQGAVYDLALSPYPYDGVLNQTRRSEVDTQVRLFSASGGLRSYAKAAIMSINGTVTIATRFDALSLSSEPPFLAAVSDSRYDIYVSGVDNQRGVELVGIYSQPGSTPIEVPYTYQGGALSTEAANWVASAQSTYIALERTLEAGNLGLNETLSGLLIERKLTDLLLVRGVITNATTSLFKGRLADKTLPGFVSSELQSLELAGPGGEAAYHLPELVSSIKANISLMPNMRSLVQNVYDTCSDLGRSPDNAGQYPLPVDVIRSFIQTGVLHSNYLAHATQTPAARVVAFNEIATTLAGVPARTTGTFTLTVKSTSFDADCPVLYTGGNVAKSLYTASGNPYRFPTTFTLQPGAQVSVTAYTDVTWNQCPGTDPLEVISLDLTAVPTASGSDADGNLLPDDYESMFLVGSGGLATSDLDGDGYSDLQEYLDGTDPDNVDDVPSAAVADFSAPIVQISTPLAGQAQLDIDWPAAYVDAFIFTVVQADNLSTTFVEDAELVRGALSGSVNVSTNDIGFYRVQVRLR